MKKEFKKIKTLLEDGYQMVDVVIEDGKFKSLKKSTSDDKTFDGKIMIPGFIDEHTHGADGYDFSTCKTPCAFFLFPLRNKKHVNSKPG